MGIKNDVTNKSIKVKENMSIIVIEKCVVLYVQKIFNLKTAFYFIIWHNERENENWLILDYYYVCSVYTQYAQYVLP